MFIQFIGMTTSGTRAQLEELIPVDTHKAKYNFVVHIDIDWQRATFDVKLQQSTRYWGALPWTVTVSLYSIRSEYVPSFQISSTICRKWKLPGPQFDRLQSALSGVLFTATVDGSTARQLCSDVAFTRPKKTGFSCPFGRVLLENGRVLNAKWTKSIQLAFFWPLQAYVLSSKNNCNDDEFLLQNRFGLST